MAGWTTSDQLASQTGRLLKPALNARRLALQERCNGASRNIPVGIYEVTTGLIVGSSWFSAFQSEIDILIGEYINHELTIGDTWTKATILNSIYSSALTAGFSGAVVLITADNLGFIPPKTGTLTLINEDGETEDVAYTDWTETAGVYSFTVAVTLAYVYKNNDFCGIRLKAPTDPLICARWLRQQYLIINKLRWAKVDLHNEIKVTTKRFTVTKPTYTFHLDGLTRRGFGATLGQCTTDFNTNPNLNSCIYAGFNSWALARYTVSNATKTSWSHSSAWVENAIIDRSLHYGFEYAVNYYVYLADTLLTPSTSCPWDYATYHKVGDTTYGIGLATIASNFEDVLGQPQNTAYTEWLHNGLPKDGWIAGYIFRIRYGRLALKFDGPNGFQFKDW